MVSDVWCFKLPFINLNCLIFQLRCWLCIRDVITIITYSLSTLRFYVFGMILKMSVYYYHKLISRLFFVMETYCVLCEVGAVSKLRWLIEVICRKVWYWVLKYLPSYCVNEVHGAPKCLLALPLTVKYTSKYLVQIKMRLHSPCCPRRVLSSNAQILG
jgi:hypothetical protein